MTQRLASHNMLHIHVGESCVLPVTVHIPHIHVSFFQRRSLDPILSDVRGRLKDLLPSLAHLSAVATVGADPDEPTISKRAQARAKPAVRECTSSACLAVAFDC
jgi:hypothetical protein